MISNYEKQYMEIVKDIIENGYYSNNRTGIPTYKLPHKIIQVDLSKEFPILQSKFVAFKTCVKEMLWIYQKQSNVVQDLRDVGVKVWNEWEREDGTIGKAYGYQIKQYHQIDKLIEALKNNPQDRRMMLNLWNVADLDDMALQPCCFCSMFDVTDGKLNCMLIQRSADMMLGNPFNTTQFAVLTSMLAQISGLKLGTLTHVINNAHIYENHIGGYKKQIENYEAMRDLEQKMYYIENDIGLWCNNKMKPKYNEKELAIIPVLKTKPVLKLNKDIKDFYDFTIDDIVLENYNHMNKINMEVAI